MNSKSLIALGAAACVVGVGAVIVLSGTADSMESGRVDTTPLFPNIATQLERVDRVVIDDGRETITLVRNPSELWGIEELDGIWVQRGKLSPILNGFAMMETMEAMTSDPANFDRLGLVDPGEGDASARRVSLHAGDEVLASLLIGNTRGGWQSTRTVYVRKPDENQTWLVRSAIDVSGDAESFRDTTIVDLPLTRIFSFRSDLWDETGIRIQRPSRETGESFMLMNIPRESDVTSQAHLEGPPRALSNLTFEDTSRDSEFFDRLVSPARITVETNDGLRLILIVRKEEEGERYWMSVEPDLSTEVELTDSVADELEYLFARHEGWYYRIPEWRATSLLRPAEEVITRRTESINAIIQEIPQIPEGAQFDQDLLRSLQNIDLSGEEFELPMNEDTMRFFFPENQPPTAPPEDD